MRTRKKKYADWARERDFPPVPDSVKQHGRTGRPLKLDSVDVKDRYTDEQLEFLRLIQWLKQKVGPHPEWWQVLWAAKLAGYRKLTGSEFDGWAGMCEDLT